MTKTDREQFTALIGALAEAFRRDATEALFRAYWIALKDLPLDLVERGCEAALRECRYMPSPVEIRERCGGTNPAMLAESAWESVVHAIRTAVGEPARFEDGLAARVVDRLGGWEHVTGQDREELLKWTRKDFIRLYAAMVADPVEGQHEARTLEGWLPGCATTMHVRAGYLDAVRQIGAGDA